MPNPWDVGSARYLQRLGFPALATTSAGFAFSRGLPDSDSAVSRDQSLAHIAETAAAAGLPVNADFASGYGAGPHGVADSVARCVATGVAGLSIEDATGDPSAPLFELPVAAERVRAARRATDQSGGGVLLTARAECYLVGHPDAFRESVRRLRAYAEAGADVLFAPGLRRSDAEAGVHEPHLPRPPARWYHHSSPECLAGSRQGLNVRQLSPEQRELVSSLAERLGSIRGVSAVVLGGSHARGRARPGSDIDLGLLYSEAAPLSVRGVRELAEAVNDTAAPVVTGFYEWGPWVNGGAWLTVGGQRVDLIYRSAEHLERVIAEAEAGRYELDYAQQPPFGFFSGTYLGEVAACVPLYDPEARLDVLKRRVAVYPEALRRAVVQDYLWAAEFGLDAFARKFAARSDAYGTAACLARAVNELVLALFALNRKYPVNDKTALAEVGEFERAPREFGPRVQRILAHPGDSAAELLAAVEAVARLLGETAELTDGLYRQRYALPK